MKRKITCYKDRCKKATYACERESCQRQVCIHFICAQSDYKGTDLVLCMPCMEEYKNWTVAIRGSSADGPWAEKARAFLAT